LLLVLIVLHTIFTVISLECSRIYPRHTAEEKRWLDCEPQPTIPNTSQIRYRTQRSLRLSQKGKVKGTSWLYPLPSNRGYGTHHSVENVSIEPRAGYWRKRFGNNEQSPFSPAMRSKLYAGTHKSWYWGSQERENRSSRKLTGKTSGWYPTGDQGTSCSCASCWTFFMCANRIWYRHHCAGSVSSTGYTTRKGRSRQAFQRRGANTWSHRISRKWKQPLRLSGIWQRSGDSRNSHCPRYLRTSKTIWLVIIPRLPAPSFLPSKTSLAESMLTIPLED